MADNKKEKKLLETYRLYVLIPAVSMTIIIVLSIALFLTYLATEEKIALILLVVVAILFLVAYVIFYFAVTRRINHVFYEQMFLTTYHNIDKIKNNDANLEMYGRSDIKEIRLLNDATKEIKERLSAAYLVVKDSNYDKLSLEFIDREKGLISYANFKYYLRNIIFLAQSFRNVIIEVYFDLPHSNILDEADKKRLLQIYMDAFKEHQNKLFAFEEDNRSLLIYLPVIDSFSEIREKLNIVINDSSVMVRDEKGIRHIPAQYALVAYPFSDEEMLLNDLRYARRQNKPYFLYLPTRQIKNKKSIFNTSMNLNYMSKIIYELSYLNYDSKDNSKNVAIFNSTFESLRDYLDVDEAGIIYYDDASEKFYPYISKTDSKLFKEGQEINKVFINALNDAVDDDQTYYFSIRGHAIYDIQREIDYYGISSGIYYVVKDIKNNKIVAVIYMFNLARDMILDSYLRESFYMLSLRIESYFEKKEIVDIVDEKESENENILLLSDIYTYYVDDNYRITHASKNMKRAIPKIQIGEYCYKALHGYEKVCNDCPMRTLKKKIVEIRKNKYEASLILNDRKNHNRVMTLQKVEEGTDYDLFFKDYLIYSYRSLVLALRNEYISQGRGYVVLLSIDNYEEIIGERGSESFGLVIRNYIRQIKNKLNTEEVYYYDATTIALHLPYLGHADVINAIESIYPISKQHFIDDGKEDSLKITYLPIGYPHGYPSEIDLLKHISDFYHSGNFNRGLDFIYFGDLSISRSASKREFMVSVLKSEFSSHNSTSMSLQPIVRVKDRHIFGAEILLRISDIHRNIFFNAEEISAIAAQENMTNMITESIINYIGNMYQEFGGNVFLINKFSRFAINIDQTYLQDEGLIKDVIRLLEANNLPKGFISFEIPENIISNYKNSISKLAKELSAYKIPLCCDRYTGTFIDVDSLKYLGFSVVKMARDLVMKVDSDPQKYQIVADIVASCKNNGLGVSGVGVENEKQFQMLRELDEDMTLQGYYLYKPLSRSDLIAALISYEK